MGKPIIRHNRGKLDPAGQRGQALVEFAISIPVLLLLLAICLDFGRAYLFDLSLRDAAFASARYAGMNPLDDPGIADAAKVAAPTGVVATGSVVVTPALATSRTSGTPVKIALSYSFRPLTPMLSSLLGGSIVLRENQTDIVK